MKIYTKTGDDGTTSLFSGGRVQEHRLDAYGINLMIPIIIAFGIGILIGLMRKKGRK